MKTFPRTVNPIFSTEGKKKITEARYFEFFKKEKRIVFRPKEKEKKTDSKSTPFPFLPFFFQENLIGE